jgi:hypothetical protein
MTVEFTGSEFQMYTAYVERLGNRFQVVFVETDPDGEVIDQIGEGEFGTVTEALDHMLGFAAQRGMEKN